MWTKIAATTLASAAILFASGCANTRDTTTARSAVEQALISQTARESIVKVDVSSELAGMSYKIDDSKLVSPDKNVLLAQIDQHLLGNGLVKGGDDADVTIQPYADFSSIDEGIFLFGLPSIMLPAPGGGQIPLPELAFFKRSRQEGRNSIGMVGTKNETGELAISELPEYSDKYYTRYTVLLFLRWNVSNLDAPFRKDTLF